MNQEIKSISIIVFFIFQCFSSFSQIDSVEIKLRKYKHLYDEGLITPQEYEQLKQNELKLGMSKPVKSESVEVDTVDSKLRKIKNRYVGDFTASVIIGIGGIILISHAIDRKNDEIPLPTNGNSQSITQYNHDVQKRDEESLVFGITGGVCSLASVIILCNGIKYAKLYSKEKKQLGVVFCPNKIGLVFQL